MVSANFKCGHPKADNSRSNGEGNSPRCAVCKRDYDAGWRVANPDAHKAISRRHYESHAPSQSARVNLLISQKRAKVSEWKLAQGCTDCGYAEHSEALDLDHVKGEKFRAISHMLSYSWERILQELEKCEVRCANCHRVRTRERAS